MIASLIAKFAAPLFIGIALGSGAILGINHLNKQDIKLECPAPIVNIKCPEASNAIDFDKIKNAKNISVNQHYHVEMNGDSLIVKKIIDEMSAELAKIRLARCK